MQILTNFNKLFAVFNIKYKIIFFTGSEIILIILSEIMPYIWIGVIIFASVAEIYTFALVSVWFVPSALAAFVLSLTGFQVWFQAAVFFIISFILLIISKIVFRKSRKQKSADSNFNPESNPLIGRAAIVTQEINNYKNTGAIKIGEHEYSAKTDDDDIIYEIGLVVTIIRIDGVQAVCSR